MRTLIHSVCYLDDIMVNEVRTGYVILADDRIEEKTVGTCHTPWDTFDEVVDGSGKLLLPGFINAHGHAAMSLLRGYADDLSLKSWLEEYIWPAEDLLTEDDIYLGTQLAMLEMIETGTTTFTDMYVYEDRVAEAVIESGMRAVLGRGLVGLDQTAEQKLQEAVSFVEDYRGAGQGRIVATLAPHAPYTCPPAFLHKVCLEAEKLGVPMQIHVAETQHEVAESQRLYGQSPVAHLQKLGVLQQRVIASHCVVVSAEDIEILADAQVHVAHNPSSNLKLGSGIAPVAQMLQAGIVVGLGTDGAASNNKLDLYEEMRLAALLQKGVLQDATLIPAATALKLATEYSAKALFLEAGLGTLQVSAQADVQLLDISGPRYFPRHSILSHVVYSSHAGDVTDVWVAGRHLYRNREFLTIDAQKVKWEADKRRTKFPSMQH